MSDKLDRALTTIPDVELLEVGLDWATSTGVFSFTEDDLVSAIASQADPGVRTPIVKLGHVDPRFDGQPAFGRVENLRLTNNGQTLVGDLVAVPVWLASIMGSAYPRRSIEGFFSAETQTGNRHPFVLTALALLGDAYPAIDTLEDVSACYGSEVPTLVPVGDLTEIAATGALVRATRVEDIMPEVKAGTLTRTPVRASTSASQVVDAFYGSRTADQQWWWVRDVLVDPSELLVDDDEGSLYLVAYTVDGDDVTFGEPRKVKAEYREVAARAYPAQVVAASYGDPVAAGRPEPSTASEGEGGTLSPNETDSGTTLPGEAPTKGEPMNLTEEAKATLRANLGLPVDATDEDVSAAILEAATKTGTAEAGADTITGGTDDEGARMGIEADPDKATTTAPAPPAGSPADEGDRQVADAEPPAASPAASPAIPEGMALIDQATLADMQARLAEASELVAANRKAEIDGLLREAVRAGKFSRAQADKVYRPRLESKDPVEAASWRETIKAMAGNAVPVIERGAALDGETLSADDKSYPASWAASVEASRRGTSTLIRKVD